MIPFKEELQGRSQSQHKRIVTCQPCIRTNDIDEVGKTRRHLTSFEMLGNFSFGDYWKEEGISWGWTLVTEHYGLNPDNLIVTVHPGDRESLSLWSQYLPESRIVKTDDNHWSSGNGEPGGICTEIFYDFQPEEGMDNISLDGDRFLEFYNLVFMDSGNVDTGLGLERLVQILEQQTSVYETSIFPGKKNPVLKDHTRTSNWLLSEGLEPSNKSRGYVLRNLMRRCFIEGFIPDDRRWLPEYRKYCSTIERGKRLLEGVRSLSQDKIDWLWDTHGIPSQVSQFLVQNNS